MHTYKYCLETGWLGQKPWFLFPGMLLYNSISCRLQDSDSMVEPLVGLSTRNSRARQHSSFRNFVISIWLFIFAAQAVSIWLWIILHKIRVQILFQKFAVSIWLVMFSTKSVSIFLFWFFIIFLFSRLNPMFIFYQICAERIQFQKSCSKLGWAGPTCHGFFPCKNSSWAGSTRSFHSTRFVLVWKITSKLSHRIWVDRLAPFPRCKNLQFARKSGWASLPWERMDPRASPRLNPEKSRENVLSRGFCPYGLWLIASGARRLRS